MMFLSDKALAEMFEIHMYYRTEATGTKRKQWLDQLSTLLDEMDRRQPIFHATISVIPED